jgi:hypothetical protein
LTLAEGALCNEHGERLACTFTPGRDGGRDVVVLGHGVTSDKDRPWSLALAAALAAEGVAALRIAFSGNGDSQGRFEDSTITKEVADLGAVLAALEGWRVAYVGHSMGAAVGVVRASRDARLWALVSLAGVTHTAEFGRRMFGHLRHGEPMLAKPRCPYGPALEADLLALDTLTPRATSVRAPWLLVHGTADAVVPHRHSLDMHAAAAAERAELLLLDGVDHSFSGAGLPRMLAAVVPWLVRELGAGG